MVSFLSVEAFRERLKEVCEKERLVFGKYPLPPFPDWSAHKKPFNGWVKDGSFVFRTNASLASTSYYIKGTYEKYNNITTVNHTMEVNRVSYFFKRCWGLVFVLLMAIFLIATEHYNLELILTIGSMTGLATIISIVIDKVRGKRLEREYIDLMDIAPNSKEE